MTSPDDLAELLLAVRRAGRAEAIRQCIAITEFFFTEDSQKIRSQILQQVKPD